MKKFLKNLRNDISNERQMTRKERDEFPPASRTWNHLNGQMAGFNKAIHMVDQQIERLAD